MKTIIQNQTGLQPIVIIYFNDDYVPKEDETYAVTLPDDFEHKDNYIAFYDFNSNKVVYNEIITI